MIEPVYTTGAPKPGGHYSQAVVRGGEVFCAGQLPIDPVRGPRTPEEPLASIEEQTRRTLANLEAVLVAAGSGLDHVLKVTVYVTDVSLWGRVNAVYAEVFRGVTPPARSVVPVGALHFGYQLEIDAIAAVRDRGGPPRAELVGRGVRLPASSPGWRGPAGELLDVECSASFPKHAIRGRGPTLWRYREAIPIDREEDIVTLGEGMTPLVRDSWRGRDVWLKMDHLFPTGSYKDRGATVLISKARSLGVTRVVEDSSGNAGASISAYCARAGIGCDIYAPASASPGKLVQTKLAGAALVRVQGSRQDTADAAWAAAQSTYYASHCWNPWFFQGTKTFAFEIVEQLGWRAPDAVVIPTGNGTLLLGAAIGFREMACAGVIDRIPRLIAVQADACAPLARAWTVGAPGPVAVVAEPTVAEGVAIASPVRGAQILEAVRASDGRVVSVPDERTISALRWAIGRGVFVEPTSATAIAALDEVPEIGGTVVVAMTGHGLKCAEKIESLLAGR